MLLALRSNYEVDAAIGRGSPTPYVRWKSTSVTEVAAAGPIDSWHALQGSLATATATARPTYQTGGPNSKPTVRFDGVNDAMSSSSGSTSLPQQTIFAVLKPGTAASIMSIRCSLQSGGLQLRLTATKQPALVKTGVANVATATTGISTSVYTIISVSYSDGGTYAFYRNGTADGSGSHGQTLTAGTTTDIGINLPGGGEFFAGDIADLIVFDSVLSAGDRAKVHSDLSDEYAITVSDYVSSTQTYSGAVNLSATATLTSAVDRTTSGTATLTTAQSLTVPATLAAFGAVSLGATAGLTSLGIRVVIGASTLTAVPTLTAAGATDQTSAVSLAVTASLTSAAGLVAFGAVTLVSTATFAVPAQLPGGAVSLLATAVMTANVLGASGAVSLTASYSLTANALRLAVSSASLVVSSTLLSSAYITTSGASALVATATLSVNATVPGGAALLTTSQSLTTLATLGAFGTISLSALPSLTVSSIRITSASVTLNAFAALLASVSQQVLVGSVSLISASSLSINLGAVGATATLTVVKTLTVNASFIGAVSLSSTSTLSVTGRLSAFGLVAVAAVPVLTVGVSVGITNGSALLSALGVLTAGGIRITNATIVPLVAAGSLSVNGLTGSGGSSNLIATSSLLVAGVAVRVSATQLTVLSTLVVSASVGALGSVTLLVGVSFSSVGVISRLGSVLLITSQTLLASGSSFLVGSVVLQAVPVLTFVDLFPEIDMSVGGSWDGGGIHTDSSPRPKSYLTPIWSGSESSMGWSTGGIHVGSVR
jgi:hypothetical protein